MKINYIYENVIIVPKNIFLDLKSLQKLAINAHSMHPIHRGMQLNQLVDALHKITLEWKLSILTNHESTVVIANQGQVSTTALDDLAEVSNLAPSSSVFWLQNPDKPFESITSSLV